MSHMPAITTDLLASYRLPANASDWTSLLTGTAFANPVSSWRCQDAASPLADGVGSTTLAATGTITYKQALAGWSSFVIKPGSLGYFGGAVGADISTTSELVLMILQLNAVPAGSRDVMQLGLTADPNKVSINNTGFLVANNKGNVATGTTAVSLTAPTVLVAKVDQSISQMTVYNNGSETIKPTWATPASSSLLYLGAGGSAWPNAVLMYGALWTGVAAERTDADVASLISRIKTGRG